MSKTLRPQCKYCILLQPNCYSATCVVLVQCINWFHPSNSYGSQNSLSSLNIMSKHILLEICLRFEEMCCVHLHYTATKTTSRRATGKFLLDYFDGRVLLKCDRTRWRTEGKVKGKLANGVGIWYSLHYLGTWCSSITTITTADAHISAASSRLKWRPRRFK
jgi:hypothetical protein